MLLVTILSLQSITGFSGTERNLTSLSSFLNNFHYQTRSTKNCLRIRKEKKKRWPTRSEEQLETEPFEETTWILVSHPLNLDRKLTVAIFLEPATFATEALGQRTNFEVATCIEAESIGAEWTCKAQMVQATHFIVQIACFINWVSKFTTRVHGSWKTRILRPSLNSDSAYGVSEAHLFYS